MPERALQDDGGGEVTQSMNEVLAESLYDRGNRVPEWPADEAAAYRDNGRFMAGTAAVEALRFQKAADALTTAGYGDVRVAQAVALEEFADFIKTPAGSGLDRHAIHEIALEALHRAAALRQPAVEEVES
jgi:hypothetical protein